MKTISNVVWFIIGVCWIISLYIRVALYAGITLILMSLLKFIPYGGFWDRIMDIGEVFSNRMEVITNKLRIFVEDLYSSTSYFSA